MTPAQTTEIPASPAHHHSDRLDGAIVRDSALASLVALTKPRLSMLSVMTAVVAYAAARPEWSWTGSLAMIVGTAFAAGGALTLNQWFERDTDCIMERTKDRPLPHGQVTPGIALAWGLFLSIAGTGLLAWKVNLLAAAIAAATIVLYVLAYTPLKSRTRWATEVGAIPGALPPLLGWAAAEGSLSPFGWMLFGILFFWQMPHFFAIGWIYREDYRIAGFPLLPVVDETGNSTAAWSLFHALALLAVSLAPWVAGDAGIVYGIGALVCGLGFAALALDFVRHTRPDARTAAARRLFAGSLVYLPAVFGCLLVDRLG